MSSNTLACDQAIFTSLRTPTGEGYRVVAASNGVRAEERQSITRLSPSHDALCWSDADDATDVGRYAASFYPLPTHRLCVSYSCHAGAEHTGRGGLRVYTHSVILEEPDFANCAYNPFVVLRAMVEAGLATPQLHPTNVLPTLELVITEKALTPVAVNLDSAIAKAWRAAVLEGLFDDRNMVVEINDRFPEVTEALLLGIPGLLRARISFGAGLRFAVGRPHRLSLLSKDRHASHPRTAGRALEYIEAAAPCPNEVSSTAWFTFVERHWSSGDLGGLAARTSQGFPDLSPTTRERFGRLFNEIDAVDKTPVGELLEAAATRLKQTLTAAEAALVAELLGKARESLLARFPAMPEPERIRAWPAVLAVWRLSGAGCAFADPLVEKALDMTGANPLVVAELALQAARKVPEQAAARGFDSTVGRVLQRLADWVERTPGFDVPAVIKFCDQCQGVRPKCPHIARIRSRCSASQPA